MQTAKRLFPYACLLAVAVILAITEADVLYTAQEQNLFLHTPLFFEQQMVKAGGLLTWAGCYLTQFFYYPMLGVGILCLLWALLMWLLHRTFRVSDQWLTLVPIACLLLTIVTLGYWVYYLKLPGALFDATLGTIIAVALTWVYQVLPAKYYLRTLFVPLATCVAYPLFGFYGLWATTLMALMAWRIDSRRLTDSLVALLAIIAVPLFCYHFVYHQTNIVNIYWAALPVFSYGDHRFFAYYLPYIALVGSISLMVCPLPNKRWLRTTVLAVTCIAVGVFWYKDGNFHREVAMSRSIVKQDWGQVLRTAQSAKGTPTRAMCLMRNLALFRTGQVGDEMDLYVNGSALPNAPFPVRMIHTFGKRLYMEYGIPNYCYRWCIEDGVEYGWTVERLRLLILCSILNSEFTAAQRYINTLKKTDFHDSWARHYESMLYHPQLMANDPALKPILPLLRDDNFLTSDQSQYEHFMIEHILSSPCTTREQQALTRFTARYYQHNRCKIIEP